MVLGTHAVIAYDFSMSNLWNIIHATQGREAEARNI